jgi:hypothetical protein
MKIPLKFGLLTALGAIAWVLIARNTVSNPQSLIHTLGAPVFFNVLHFAMIYLGIKALEHEKGERPTFKEGLKTGVAISFVYGLINSLFFAGALFVVGGKWLESEPGAADIPISSIAARAFAAFFIGTLVFGLIYSTVISFFLAKREHGSPQI